MVQKLDLVIPKLIVQELELTILESIIYELESMVPVLVSTVDFVVFLNYF